MDEELKRQLAESIKKWEARPRYRELTPEVLARVPDDLVEQAIVDFVMAHGVWEDDDLLALFASLPEGFGIVYTTWTLDAEVDNGGFHQYFWNTKGRYVDLLTMAVARIGSPEHARTLEEAVRGFRGQGLPDTAGLDAGEEVKRFSASALAARFDSFDSRWYELGGLAAARVRFIRDSPELFTARLPR